MKRFTALLHALALTVLLGGCSGFDKIPGVYRLDVQQGNVLDPDQLHRLEHGMSKRQVRFILGTPMLTDAFNPDRWDYIYTFKPGGGDPVQRRVSIFFEDDTLASVKGDVKTSVRRAVPKRRDQIVKVDGPIEGDNNLLSAINPFDEEPEPEPDADQRSVWEKLTGADPEEAKKTKTTIQSASVTKEDEPKQEGESESLWDRLTKDARERLATDDAAAPATQQPADAAATPASLTGQETRPDPNAESQSPSLFDQLTTRESTAASAPAPEVPQAPQQQSAEEKSRASALWDRLTGALGRDEPDKPETAAASQPEEGGGIFDRIRKRFDLPDDMDPSTLIEVSPAPESDTESAN